MRGSKGAAGRGAQPSLPVLDASALWMRLGSDPERIGPSCGPRRASRGFARSLRIGPWAGIVPATGCVPLSESLTFVGRGRQNSRRATRPARGMDAVQDRSRDHPTDRQARRARDRGNLCGFRLRPEDRSVSYPCRVPHCVPRRIRGAPKTVASPFPSGPVPVYFFNSLLDSRGTVILP